MNKTVLTHCRDDADIVPFFIVSPTLLNTTYSVVLVKQKNLKKTLKKPKKSVDN